MPSQDDSHPRCRKCGARLAAGILDGACPACLWQQVLDGDAAEPTGYPAALTVDGHEVFEEIGQGGMGVVYRARQHQPPREVALKIVAPYSLRMLEARRRFFNEVEAMAAIEHPAVLPLYQSGEDEYGRPWLTMLLVRGGTLAEHRDRYAGQWREIARLAVVLCGAIAYAHERGVLHRDLKPANILFDSDGHPYIADFGLAKWAEADTSLTQTSYLMGSPAYLAPEAAAGGSSATTTVSDVYGLGAILYELLTGTAPYEGKTASDILTRIIQGEPPAPRKIHARLPRDLEVIVLTAMARAPGQRYASAAAMADDLQRWLDGREILARPLGPLARLWGWARRKPALAALAAALALSLTGGAALLWRANVKLTASLDDAEARVEFMTRELPARLAPMGRLDLLDEVFLDVSRHYDLVQPQTPEGLARHADFHTQWSQIKLPRGDTRGAITELEQALAIAETAVRRAGTPGLPVARARVHAGWRLGEALIKERQWERAAEALATTRKFADSIGTDDLEFRALVAQLALEPAFLEMGRGRNDAALAAAEESLALWKTLRPRLEREITTPRHQRTLIVAAQAHTTLAEIHRARGDQAAHDRALRASLASSTALLALLPDHQHIRYHHGETLLIAGIHLSAPIAERRALVLAADRIFADLVAQDAANLRWRCASLESAMRLNELAKLEGLADERTRWAETAEQRVLPLYRTRMNDLVFLRSITRYALFCGKFRYRTKTWDQVCVHWAAALRAARQAHRQSGLPADLESYHSNRTWALEWLTRAIGDKAAQAWLRETDKDR